MELLDHSLRQSHNFRLLIPRYSIKESHIINPMQEPDGIGSLKNLHHPWPLEETHSLGSLEKPHGLRLVEVPRPQSLWHLEGTYSFLHLEKHESVPHLKESHGLYSSHLEDSHRPFIWEETHILRPLQEAHSLRLLKELPEHLSSL